MAVLYQTPGSQSLLGPLTPASATIPFPRPAPSWTQRSIGHVAPAPVRGTRPWAASPQPPVIDWTTPAYPETATPYLPANPVPSDQKRFPSKVHPAPEPHTATLFLKHVPPLVQARPLKTEGAGEFHRAKKRPSQLRIIKRRGGFDLGSLAMAHLTVNQLLKTRVEKTSIYFPRMRSEKTGGRGVWHSQSHCKPHTYETSHL